MSYTSAMKANHDDLARVTEIGHDCLTQAEATKTTENPLQLDYGFFHTWLQICVDAIERQQGDMSGRDLAEEIV